MKRTVVAAVAALLLAPALAFAAGIPGATVKLVDTATTLPVGTVVTDGEGGFAFDNVPASSYSLEVATADLKGLATLLFGIAAADAPARLTGRVTALEGADLSLQVNASITAAGEGAIVLAPGFPKIPPAWNRNWVRANGQLHVRLAGTGLEGLEKVVLTSAKATPIETTVIVKDPVSGVYHAIFPKRAAFLALVPATAVRGTVVPIKVGVTTPVASGEFDASFRVVGSKKHPRH